MISSLDDDYADRLSDLLEDMEGDGVDSVGVMMNWIAGYVQGALEREQGDCYVYQFEGEDMVIQLIESDEQAAARMH